MKSKIIFIAAAVCMLAVCSLFSKYEKGIGTERVHQHMESEWQAGEGADKDSTHLPIVMMETGGQKVPGTPIIENFDTVGYETSENGEKTIQVSFSLIDGQKGENRLSDTPDVESYARIRYRGKSSRHFDKKSYSVHLVDEEDKENPKSLAGMAVHDEYVLNGPFLDRSLIRNYLCMNLAGEIMEYAPNVRFCELYLDGEYQGLYLLMESVTRGEGRIDIPKPEKNSSVTSYIVRWDRVGKGDQELNNYAYYTFRGGVSVLDVRYPGKNQITDERMAYIENDISKMEKVLYSYDLTDERKGITNYIDLNSFAEYFVINEFFRNTDAGRFSTFYYKDARGKLKTCVWDFNNACDNYIEDVHDENGFSLQDTPWFDQLMKDERFVTAVVSKYRQLRKTVFSEEYLMQYIDDTVAWLGDEVEKNYEVWGYVFSPEEYQGIYFGANFLMPRERNVLSYEEAVEQLKSFLKKRGRWLDKHIDSLFQYCHTSKNVIELTR